ncbi:DUF5813 family protein [Halorubrum ezzemoulense]|uniref:DUF5813 family protein n=1 Tax=Halorubrum ezzemoulense TaxID=337243 RepID=A0ABT4YZ59_HALEZ|nr:DUF5813 family protein [Halorubrum ezzemoulense]MDB2243285.1 DUF5813 family protein [Halorubrum ezzemoulense]MDB2251355.1 DUF5813 family protein [Halorubrum ezzemoulense]MDB2277020.1 DUF5813 family protein [Halorubrum ezzemoulense]MDB2283744.1 DUF5813 family protein [Halorubrum ezzemoulense]MDB2288647.1 DUF5813 family protein [Halorubrum ezzemoulense]
MTETEDDDADAADELPGRVRRAFGDHGSFERDGDGWVSTTTAFDGRVRAEPAGEGRIRFTVTVRVPMLSAATAEEVADVVEDGWVDTFERRAVDVGGVTRKDRDFDPAVERDDDEIAITYALSDINERRGVDDAGALIDFVEGTYVQGVIPGYEYTAPVSDLLSAARQQGGGGPV